MATKGHTKKRKSKYRHDGNNFFHNGKLVLFLFSDGRGGSDLSVSWTTDPNNKYGTQLCYLSRTERPLEGPMPAGSDSGVELGEEYWAISNFRDWDGPEEITKMKVPTKWLAAEIAFAYRAGITIEREKKPLPDGVSEYIVLEARNLRYAFDANRDELSSLQSKRRHLLYLGKEYGIRLDYERGNDDAAQCVKDMVKLETDCGVNIIEFLYEHFGKDFGRTYTATLKCLARRADVDAAEELL